MKELWLFTRMYPEGAGEAFLANALPVWCEAFSKVRVFPMFRGKGYAELPPNVQVEHLWSDAYRTLSVPATLQRVRRFTALLAQRKGDGGPAVGVSHARQLLYKSDVVTRQLMPMYDPERVAVLSVWMEDWVNVLGLVKEQHPALRFASMAHGSDLYVERHSSGRIAFRAQQMEWVDRVICIAQHGAGYLRTAYPVLAGKVTVAHLGTVDHGQAPWVPDPTLRIVSCAYLRPPKRVDMIAQAMQQVERPVHWTHFGDGPERAALERAVSDLPPHITFTYQGAVAPPLITQWYRTHPVDLFVHLSGHEGVPVSMMEAIGFGIPVVANAVGGVGELLAPSVGVLLPATTSADDLAAWIDGPGPDKWRTQEMRHEVRRYWSQHFSAQRNFQYMITRFP